MSTAARGAGAAYAGLASFVAQGNISKEQLGSYSSTIWKKRIERLLVDAGDRNAGLIRVVSRGSTPKEFTHYRIHINRNHDVPVQFATLAHELGHLFLGHLGPDKMLNVPERSFVTDAPRLYDQQGNYCGKLSTNPYDPDSTSNPFSRCGSPFSHDSINNLYGAGSQYRLDSPTNPYGRDLRIEGK